MPGPPGEPAHLASPGAAGWRALRLRCAGSAGGRHSPPPWQRSRRSCKRGAPTPEVTELARQPAPAPSPAPGHPASRFSFPKERAGHCSTNSGPTHGSTDVNGPTAPQCCHRGGRPGGRGAGTEPAAPGRGPGSSRGATRTFGCTGSNPKGDAGRGVHRLTFWPLASLFSRQPHKRPGQECLSARMWPDLFVRC